MILKKRVTARGYTVTSVRYSADPEKDDTWLEKVKQECPDLATFQREFCLDWSSSSGLPFYPEFLRAHHLDKGYYIRNFETKKGAVIVRGWDFGRRRPAVVWFQVVDGYRVQVLQELMPEDIDVHSLRELIMFASGQIPINDGHLMRRPRAMDYIQKYAEGQNAMPWFDLATRFMDFSGPESLRLSELAGEAGERNAYEVLQDRNIQLDPQPQRVSAGEYIISRLILAHPDGKGPGLMLRPHCHILIRGLAGGLTHSKGVANKPAADTVNKDGYFEHLHDALRYGVVGVIPVTEGILDASLRTNRLLEAAQPQGDSKGVYRRNYQREDDVPGGERYASLDDSGRYFGGSARR